MEGEGWRILQKVRIPQGTTNYLFQFVGSPLAAQLSFTSFALLQ